MSDVSERTVCGLWLVDLHEYDLSNFSWHTKVIDDPDSDEDENVAEEFVRQEMMHEIGQSLNGDMVMPNGVLCGPQHEGHVSRETYFNGTTDLLSLSHPWVPDNLISRESVIGLEDLRRWTVCGITRYEHTPVVWDCMASNPLMAYQIAWQMVMDDTGQEILLCAVHAGQV